MTKPSIGSSVHVEIDGQHCAAVISKVHDDGRINVRAFGDNDEIPARLEQLEQSEWHWPEPVWYGPGTPLEEEYSG